MAGQNRMTIRRAAFINMCSRYAAALVQFVYTIVLARLLTPDAFGLVAIAQVFVVFFGLFADMGLGSAIVQRQDLESVDISRLFGFSIVLGIVLGGLFACLGLPISNLYRRGELVLVCVFLSLSVFLSTLNIVPNALLMKQERFLVVGVRQVVCAVVASIVGVGCALVGVGYMSIVAYSVSNSLFVFSWNWGANRIRLIVHGMIGAARKVFSYSAWLFGFNLVNYFSRNADNLLAGYAFGAASLGNYSKAYHLMQMPQTYLTSVVTSVMHPILAKHQDNLDYIYSVFVRTAKILSLIGVFLSVFSFFCASETITVIYGEQWRVAVPCFQFLALSIWSQMVCGTSGSMFQVLNQTKLQFVRGAIIAVVVVGAAFVGVAYGSIEVIALRIGIAYFVGFMTLCPFLIRISFHREIRPFLKLFLPDLAIASFS